MVLKLIEGHKGTIGEGFRPFAIFSRDGCNQNVTLTSIMEIFEA